MSKALIEKAFENMPLEKVEKIPQKSFWITVNIHPNKTDQKPDTVKVVLEIDGEIDPIVDTVYDGDSHILNSRNLMPLLQASATWQREQLESKQTKIKCSNCGAEVSSYVPKDTVIRGYVECPECITKTNVATVTHDIYKQAREQLEAENKELSNKLLLVTTCVCKTPEEYINNVEKWNLKYLQQIADLQAKVEELEKENIDLALRPKDLVIKTLQAKLSTAEQRIKEAEEIMKEINIYIKRNYDLEIKEINQWLKVAERNVEDSEL